MWYGENCQLNLDLLVGIEINGFLCPGTPEPLADLRKQSLACLETFADLWKRSLARLKTFADLWKQSLACLGSAEAKPGMPGDLRI